MGKKNLEQLFKEVFKDFKETPDEKVWASIEASLNKKEQKKRVVPIWWRLGGIAALLAILFYVINPFEGSNENGDVIISETQNGTDASDNDTNNADSEKADPFATPAKEQVVESSKNDNLEADTNTEQGEADDLIINSSRNSGSQLVANPDERPQESPSNNNTIQKNKLELIKAHDQEVADVNVDQRNENQIENDAAVVAETNTSDLKNIESISSENNRAEGVEHQEKLFEIPNNEAVAVTENKKNNQQNTDEELNHSQEKKSIFEVIEEREEEALAETSSPKWSVGPSVAPVYFSATGNGSPIHSSFASNSKSGNVNLSYGLTVAYELGKKLKVRSGVHRVNYGYDTNDVVFSASLGASANDMIDNIDYSQAARTVIVQSKNSSPEALANDAFLELAAGDTPSLDGKMIQQLGYIEVPLEVDYALVDKKFGVNIIGGVSSLFLVDNSVLLESNDLVTEVGEANNANSVNFSTNVGVGLNYEFSSKVQLNLEPVLKYQLNTFSETAGSFRPFSVGVYSGVRFKF
ncbi:outer membrane beta-barrel protein [Flagellimonas sp.]|uniref:outer membrane beta-barrel protein n=1 Tax=Flagellimonas sp. TaxID=2058762 RepID=UPI003B513C17